MPNYALGCHLENHFYEENDVKHLADIFQRQVVVRFVVGAFENMVVVSHSKHDGVDENAERDEVVKVPVKYEFNAAHSDSVLV
jgi:hypothetical protein